MWSGGWEVILRLAFLAGASLCSSRFVFDSLFDADAAFSLLEREISQVDECLFDAINNPRQASSRSRKLGVFFYTDIRL